MTNAKNPERHLASIVSEIKDINRGLSYLRPEDGTIAPADQWDQYQDLNRHKSLALIQLLLLRRQHPELPIAVMLQHPERLGISIAPQTAQINEFSRNIIFFDTGGGGTIIPRYSTKAPMHKLCLQNPSVTLNDSLDVANLIGVFNSTYPEPADLTLKRLRSERLMADRALAASGYNEHLYNLTRRLWDEFTYRSAYVNIP